MAESESGQEKTEEPSEKRIDQARDDGQIARTQELGSLVILATSMAMLSILGPSLGLQMAESIRTGFALVKQHQLQNTIGWLSSQALPILQMVLIFTGILSVFSIIGSFLQTGIHYTPKALSPKWSNVSPKTGLKRIFSTQILVTFLKNFFKVFIIGFIAYQEVKSRLDDILISFQWPIVEAIRWCGDMISTLVFKVCLFLASLAALDYLYNWFKLHQQLMMTRQELKDELKEGQVSENVRRKVRQVSQERAKRTIQKEVPKADVIITNPTHFAVALRYKRYHDRAPRVVAKGQDLLAKTIRDVASKNNIPLYEYPELARKLYKTVKVGDFIPGELFEAVAKVLAFVYRLHEQRKAVRV